MDRGTDEHVLARSSMVKSIDSWWTVLLVDPVAVPITRVLARRPSITPVAVTCVAHLLGAVTVALFMTGELVLGAVLFEIRFVLDCVDGKLARATGRASAFGRELDIRGDQFLTVAMIVALGWHADFAATAVLAGAYPLQMFFLDSRNRLAGEASQPRSTADAPTTSSGGWRAAMARRRMYPIPTSVDIEQLTFFVGPLVAGAVGGISVLLWVATAWFGLQLIRYWVEMLVLAHRADIRAAADR